MNNELIFKLSGLVLLLSMVSYYGIYKMIRNLIERSKIQKEGKATLAKIVDNVSREIDGSTYYHPVLYFITEDGLEVNSEGKEGRAERYKIGDEVIIYYLPTDPFKFHMASSSGIVEYLAILITISGSLILIIAIVDILKF